MQDKFETHIITTEEDFNSLVSYYNDIKPEYLVIDTETDSEKEKIAKLYGIGLCFEDNESFYIPERAQNGDNYWSSSISSSIHSFIKRICSETKIIGHNIGYDVLVLKNNLTIDIMDNVYSDTLLMKHTFKSDRPFGLKELAAQYLGPWAVKAQEELYTNIELNGGKVTKDCLEMFKANTDVLGRYCCWDVILTKKLFKIFSKELQDKKLEDLFYNLEVMPLYKLCTVPMKEKGFPIDVAHFEKLKEDITKDISQLETYILSSIEKDIEPFINSILDKEFPIKATGNFPKALADYLNIPLPQNKEGKLSLAKKGLLLQLEQNSEFADFYNWVLGNLENPPASLKEIKEVQKKLFFNKNPDRSSIFNLKSNNHLIELLINIKGYKPLDTTEGGAPMVDDTFIESLKGKEAIVDTLIDFKKLNKILGTYIEGILDRQINGVIYTSFLQFGTQSGRYSSTNPNLQNLPRPKDEDSDLSPLVLKYVNAIRKGFIAPEGYILVDADQSALEPRVFSHVSGDKKLIEVWEKGEDLYSRIAIDIFDVKGVSANPKDANYLKNVNPELRQKVKTIVLAIPYGSEESRVCELLGCSYEEAGNIIRKYLNSYPELKKWMARSNYKAKRDGFVISELGRIRTIPEAKIYFERYGDELLDYKFAKKRGLIKERREYKNALNAGRNHQIQSLSASIINRASIEICKEFKKRNINAYLGSQVHDQLLVIAKKEVAEEVKKIMKDKMENTVKISVALIADPKIASNMGDSH